HSPGIPHFPTGQELVEHTNRTLKDMLTRQKTPQDSDVQNWLSKAWFTLNYLSLTEDQEEPPVSIHHRMFGERTPSAIPGLQVLYKDLQTGTWN
ncbi:POK6 protein, partial [Rhinopomastus cyanomelas]|nr:POK6 protein [Rhinopomastus cyanomelas]